MKINVTIKFLLFLYLFVYTKCELKQNTDEDEDSDSKPGKCERPAEFFYEQCCVFPPFYTRDVAKECGAVSVLNYFNKKENITAATRLFLKGDCDHWRCVLARYKQLATDESLNIERYFSHLDRWADLNPKFKGVIAKAQVFCKNNFRMLLPLHVCRFSEINTCIRHYVTVNCPAVVPTQTCYEQKQFYINCRKYFI